MHSSKVRSVQRKMDPVRSLLSNSARHEKLSGGGGGAGVRHLRCGSEAKSSHAPGPEGNGVGSGGAEKGGSEDCWAHRSGGTFAPKYPSAEQEFLSLKGTASNPLPVARPRSLREISNRPHPGERASVGAWPMMTSPMRARVSSTFNLGRSARKPAPPAPPALPRTAETTTTSYSCPWKESTVATVTKSPPSVADSERRSSFTCKCHAS